MASDDTKQPEAEMSWEETRPALIKLALELGPLIVFFAVNAMGEKWLEQSPLLSSWFSQPIIFATAVFMVAMAISLLLSWLLLKRVAVMPLVTGAVVLVFGTLTLVFQDSMFIKMKPTIVNSLFGAVLLGGLLFRQSLLRYVFGDVYKLKPEGWRKLTINWGLFFVFLAVSNEVVWRMFDTDFWVAFKVWGIMPITVVFSMLQLPLLTRYALDPKAPIETIPPMDPMP